ncbi:hypothetical protein MSPP1_002882 [Malassezia sp. CBS 17886]|nr:hypothetical protein MSPP1_002882 [Malassezia sp. CBS 17886]
MTSVLQYTPTESIPPLVNNLRDVFLSGKTRSLKYRSNQLKQLAYLVQDNEALFVEALQQDLGRAPMETSFGEITTVKNEIIDALRNLHSWAKVRTVNAGSAFMLHGTQVRHDPKGTVLVLGAWNYPITLLLGPAVYAIAAGNTVMLKPSEVSEHTAKLITELWPKYMDRETSTVVNGGVDQATALLDERYEHVFYTGNGHVGSIVASKAAKHLCPVTLELGGKSPVIIDETANLSIAAHRIVWAKCFNAGQTCIAPDYVLVHRSVQDKFVAEVQKVAKKFWTSMNKDMKDFGRIVNTRHWNRLRGIITATRGDIVMGGTQGADEATRFIPFTLIKNVRDGDATLGDELFGPILPIVPVDSVRSAVEIMNARDQPLSLYIFTASDAVCEYILTYTRSGAAIRGDLLLHFAVDKLPFGGTGPSGYGSYHGKAGFDTFTHERAFIDAPANGILGAIVEKLMASRYPPYSAGKERLFAMILGKRIFFGRPKNPTESTTSINNAVSKSMLYNKGYRTRLLALLVLVLAVTLKYMA